MEGGACNLKQNSQVRQNLKGLGFLIKSDWRMWLGLKLGRGWRAFHLLLRIANRAAVSTGLIYPFSRRSESRKRSSRGLAAAAQAHSPSHCPIVPQPPLGHFTSSPDPCNCAKHSQATQGPCAAGRRLAPALTLAPGAGRPPAPGAGPLSLPRPRVGVGCCHSPLGPGTHLSSFSGQVGAPPRSLWLAGTGSPNGWG